MKQYIIVGPKADKMITARVKQRLHWFRDAVIGFAVFNGLLAVIWGLVSDYSQPLFRSLVILLNAAITIAVVVTTGWAFYVYNRAIRDADVIKVTPLVFEQYKELMKQRAKAYNALAADDFDFLRGKRNHSDLEAQLGDRRRDL